jgi:hypothetical protein
MKDIYSEPYEKRVARLRKEPALKKLEKKLLSMGGDRVALMPDPHATIIVERGQVWKKRTKLFRMQPNHCHGNVAELWFEHRYDGMTYDLPEGEGFKIVTGWVLDKADGCWIQHSWGVDTVLNRIIETTMCRKTYFGVMLNHIESAKFFLNNAELALSVFALMKTVQDAPA